MIALREYSEGVRPVGIAPRQGKRNELLLKVKQQLHRCVCDAVKPCFDSCESYRNNAVSERRRARQASPTHRQQTTLRTDRHPATISVRRALLEPSRQALQDRPSCLLERLERQSPEGP